MTPRDSDRPRPKIALGGILTECNHFGGLPIDVSTYEASELWRGDQLLQAETSVVGGMLKGLRFGDGVDIAPLLYASACAGGPIAADCYQQLRTELLTRLEAAQPVDGVLMPLHGSALAEGEDDPEGDLLEAVRERVGSEIPVIATLDLHAHVTGKMVREADALLAWETYPHRDQFAVGERAATLLRSTIAGQCRPTMALAKVPVITSAINASTEGDDPFAELMRFTKALESQPGVLTSSLFLIHPYMDVLEMGSGGLVVTDNDLPKAKELAAAIARKYWLRRRDLEPEVFAPGDAISRGLQIAGGPVILVETADCCGGGAAGDSIATLSALVDARLDHLSLAPLVDPAAAEACHHAGVGSELTLALGHQLDPRWGTPRTFTGVVERLCDGRFTYTGGQWEGHREDMGPSAVFAIGSVRVLIMSRATYDWADEQFRAAELKPEQAKFVVAKNPMNYRLAYGSIAAAVFVLDTPGPTPPTLKHHTFEKLARPFFPADDEIENLEPTVLT